MAYLLLKAAHVFGVVLFLGNIITGIFWKVQADLTNTLPARAQALDGIIKADRWFTVPGVFLILVTGVSMALLANLSLLRTFWISGSLALFGISGLAFGIAVGPLQKKLLANVRAGLGGSWDESQYKALSRSWGIWGLVATVAPVIALALMVIKPA